MFKNKQAVPTKIKYFASENDLESLFNLLANKQNKVDLNSLIKRIQGQGIQNDCTLFTSRIQLKQESQLVDLPQFKKLFTFDENDEDTQENLYALIVDGDVDISINRNSLEEAIGKYRLDLDDENITAMIHQASSAKLKNYVTLNDVQEFLKKNEN